MGAEPRLPRSLFCREGRRLPTTSTVISACGGKKGRDRETERELCACLGARRSPAQAQAVASPGGAQSIRRPGEWCEVWCLLCHGKTAAYEGRGAPDMPAATFEAYTFLLSLAELLSELNLLYHVLLYRHSLPFSTLRGQPQGQHQEDSWVLSFLLDFRPLEGQPSGMEKLGKIVMSESWTGWLLD